MLLALTNFKDWKREEERGRYSGAEDDVTSGWPHFLTLSPLSLNRRCQHVDVGKEGGMERRARFFGGGGGGGVGGSSC